MSVDDLEKYLAATGDMTPIYFLIEKYLSDEEAKRKRAMAELARKMPEFMSLFQAAMKVEGV
ncbi:hypothetical protein ACP3WA_26240, partial [Salmonella enterica]|uniref:hypothetical protein n=1 Tax=Salmonella enterica TaxID=28901 RepID=UPI003CE76325